MVHRAEVVAKAREFLDTPFHHQGRTRGRGLDCVGLVLCVGGELGLCDVGGVPIHVHLYANYPAQPFGRIVHNECMRRLVIKWLYDPARIRDQGAAPPLELLDPGDVLTMRNPKIPTHTAIVGSLSAHAGDSYLTIIHAYPGAATRKSPGGKVAEHILDKKWLRRIEGVFSFPGVTE
jgi:hypothetical protein